jgi:hypothetical protein
LADEIPHTGALMGFLPAFLAENRERMECWHYLFEPGCLVRFASTDPEAVFESASRLAVQFGMTVERGDISKYRPSPENYEGDLAFYKSAELFDASLKLVEVGAQICIILNNDKSLDGFAMMRKFMHLLSNQFGCSYLEEAALGRYTSDRAIELFKKYGR